MDSSHQTILRTNRVYLVRNLYVNEELLSFLTAKRTVSEDMAEEIKEVYKTKSQKAGALMDLLPRRGPHAFRAFIEGLVETDQGHVADMLDKACADRYRAQSGRPQEDPYPEGTPVHRHPQHVPAKHIPVNTVKVDQSFIEFTIMNVDSTDGVLKNNDTANYTMKSKPRGRCVILNIDQFSAEANQKDRYGSNFDVVNLTELFKNLLFDVKLWTNLSKEKILSAIKEERMADHHAYDAFIMIILSHGHEGIIYSQDGEKISIEKDIVNQFNGVHCKDLINKPKLFFIQACQGNEKTIGVVADGEEADSQVGTDDLEELMKQLGGGGEDTSDSVKDAPGGVTHEQADIYLAYSTVPGYKAWRHTSLGSWFMRDLVTVFAQYCHMEHVADMLTRVNQLVDARKVEGTGQYRQICRIVSQLRKRVYLLPGYFAD